MLTHNACTMQFFDAVERQTILCYGCPVSCGYDALPRPTRHTKASALLAEAILIICHILHEYKYWLTARTATGSGQPSYVELGAVLDSIHCGQPRINIDFPAARRNDERQV
jgi:hypothetical protein